MNWLASLLVLLGLAATSACVAPAQDEPQTKTGKTALTQDQPVEIIKVGQASWLPVKSKYLDEIEDSGHDTPEDKEALCEMPLEAMAAILSALKDIPLERLAALPDLTSDFNVLMKEPTKNRGTGVQLSGVLQDIQPVEIRPNASGITACWMGQISTARRRIITFISIEPLHEDIKVGQGVQISGIFYKRYAYRNREVGGKLTICPLIITPRAVAYSELGTGANTSGLKFTWLEVVVCLGALVVICGALYGRSMQRTSRLNVFTRRKELLSGPPKDFPGPNLQPTEHKPDPTKPS